MKTTVNPALLMGEILQSLRSLPGPRTSVLPSGARNASASSAMRAVDAKTVMSLRLTGGTVLERRIAASYKLMGPG